MTEANCLERWKEHFSLLLQHNTTPADPTILVAANAAAPSDACSTDPVTPVEVRAIKAPGICAITAEMLKSGGDSIVEWLTHIFNQVWETERLPSDWTRGVILPFWKCKGDRLVCGNHRGITLLSIPSKLFTRILLTRALPAIRSSRHPQQAGFMPNRSTIDHISAVQLLIEKTYEFRKDRHLYMAFIDLKAAFDTVCHSSLWSILQALGAPSKIVVLLKLLYSNAQSCVRVNGRDSDWFPISSGFRQGCVAAPDLFNCIIDHLMSKVCERIPGVPFGSYHLTDLEYADDTILFSTSYSQLRDALGIYSEEAEKLGLHPHSGKFSKRRTELHEKDYDGQKAIYWEVKYPFPLSNRDYVYVRERRDLQVNGRKIWVVLARSSAVSHCPEKSGIIRVKDYKQTVAMETDGAQGTKIFMNYFDNPGGNIPAWLINWAAKSGVPGFLKDMQDACTKYATYCKNRK
ncbi:hypothetical protein PDJAM_G00176320 [Pangasius djambal]|uniref:Uncharacterized protein n=1 Tax=Pangasius djambal TaxID=1691987 RepID=A0ACC5ZP43_9TELE|nr:hypothetical protein [Pangasius djambal]